MNVPARPLLAALGTLAGGLLFAFGAADAIRRDLARRRAEERAALGRGFGASVRR